MLLMVCAFFISAVAFLQTQIIPSMTEKNAIAVADAGATSFLAYREAVIDYSNSNPNITNKVVSAGDLNYSLGYKTNNNWANKWSSVISNGTVYIYENDPTTYTSPQVIDRLFKKTDDIFYLGWNSNNSKLITVNGYSTEVTIPSVVPAGAIVMVGK